MIERERYMKMKVMKVLIGFMLFVGVIAEDVADPIVITGSGTIRGVRAKTPRNNVTVYAFMQIPYAEPPLGSLRFQPPKPVANWSGILDAKVFNKICYQADKTDPNETEDCLYLSVITPSINVTAKLPVMLHIHGGAFVHGHGMSGALSSQMVIEKGVIVVSINYRLGPFGFLSTGDKVVSGNMGLKDQQLAIKWVNKNIEAFGGDPKKVTLAGQSAGGASVTYQLLNLKNKGLFRAVISNSGSTLCEWAYQRHHLDSAYGIAKMINPNITRNISTKKLVDFLRNVSAAAIDKTGNNYNIWSPIIEVPNSEAFFTESMYELVRKGQIIKVPLLIGINSEECISWVKDLNQFKNGISQYDRRPVMLVNEDMYINKKIKDIYTNSTWQDNPGAAVQYLSDDTFTRGIIKYAELQSAYTDVYFYQFSYHGNLGNNVISVPGIGYGVAHAEDQRYLWVHYNNKISSDDLLITDRYVTLQTNFIKSMNPTPGPSELLQNIIWPKVISNKFSYLNINTTLEIKENPRLFSYSKWVKIWEADARKPFISY